MRIRCSPEPAVAYGREWCRHRPTHLVAAYRTVPFWRSPLYLSDSGFRFDLTPSGNGIMSGASPNVSNQPNAPLRPMAAGRIRSGDEEAVGRLPGRLEVFDILDVIANTIADLVVGRANALVAPAFKAARAHPPAVSNFCRG